MGERKRKQIISLPSNSTILLFTLMLGNKVVAGNLKNMFLCMSVPSLSKIHYVKHKLALEEGSDVSAILVPTGIQPLSPHA